MRQFRATQHFSLPVKRRLIVGAAFKLELSDCSIYVPQAWVKRTLKNDKGWLDLYFTDFFSKEIAQKIRNAGGKTGRYKELMSINKHK